MRLFTTTAEARQSLLDEALTRGFLPARQVRNVAHSSEPTATAALQQLVATGWLVATGAGYRLNRDQPGLLAYADWRYIHDGIRLAPEDNYERYALPPAPWEEVATWESEVGAAYPAVMSHVEVDHDLTPARLRATRLQLLSSAPRWGFFEGLHQTLYSRRRNERSRDLIHLFLASPVGTTVGFAASSLDLDDNAASPAELGRRWLAAVVLVNQSVHAIMATAARLIESADRAAEIRGATRTAVRSWAGAGRGLVGGVYERQEQQSAQQRRVALINSLELGRHYCHGGTPSPDDIGTAGEEVHAAWLASCAENLVRIITSDPTGRLVCQVGLDELDWTTQLPKPSQTPPTLPKHASRHYTPPPAAVAATEEIKIRAGELRTGDYIVAVDGQTMQNGPLHVVDGPHHTEPLGPFTVMGREDTFGGWLMYTAAIGTEPLTIQRPT